MLKELDKKYGKEKEKDKHDNSGILLHKKNEESMQEYVNRYELTEDKCKRIGRVYLGEDMRCVH